VIDVYHDTKYAPLASFNKINLLANREKNYDALTEANKFLEKYPNDENYKEVEDIKATLISKLSAKP
jgi:outer membrane protein assembly factor BamD